MTSEVTLKDTGKICCFKTTAAQTKKSICITIQMYRETSNIRCTLVSNNIVDLSDVAGASPVGAAPTTSSFST